MRGEAQHREDRRAAEFPYLDERRRGLGPARPRARRRRRRLPRLRRDPARAADDLRRAWSRGRSRSSTRRRRRRSTRASAAATSCTGSRTRAWRSASAARSAPPPAPPTASASSPPRTTPSDRVSAGERYAEVYEINLSPLHLLRLLRGRLPLRRDHDGPRLRDVGLQPLRPDLHQGDAARRADRAYAAAAGGRVGWTRGLRERPDDSRLRREGQRRRLRGRARGGR